MEIIYKIGGGDNMDYIIRPIQINDAEPFWEMMFELDSETKYMMYEPNERVKDIDKVKSIIGEAVTGDNLLLVAEANHKIVGYISAEKGTLSRIKHSAYIVVGILAAYQGRGIGGMFFKELDNWAYDKNITRLELTVMCRNEMAKHLYEKNGFVIEGIKKKSMIVDGTYIDEYYMAKIR